MKELLSVNNPRLLDATCFHKTSSQMSNRVLNKAFRMELFRVFKDFSFNVSITLSIFPGFFSIFNFKKISKVFIF